MYFIKVTDGKTLRRKILESSKASINILRSNQHLEEIRQEKLELLEHLRREMKELTMLVNKVSDLMPSLSKAEVKEITDLDKIPKTRSKPDETRVFVGSPEEKSQPKIEPIPTAPPSEEKKKDLHSKLAAIEAKLNKL